MCCELQAKVSVTRGLLHALQYTRDVAWNAPLPHMGAMKRSRTQRLSDRPSWRTSHLM